MKFMHIPIDKIIIKDNIRSDHDEDMADLMDSIERHDIIQPILVTPHADRFLIVIGHRRFAAMRSRNEPTIPCIIRDDIANEDRVWIQLVENTHRKKLSALEYVEIFNRIREEHRRTTGKRMTVRHLAVMLGKTIKWVEMHYQAVTSMDRLVSSGIDRSEVERMTTGQVLGKIYKGGLQLKQRNGPFYVSRSNMTFRVQCKNSDVMAQVREALKQLRRRIRISDGKA